LQQIEIGSVVRIERDDLAIQDGQVGKLLERIRNVLEFLVQYVATSGVQRRLPRLFHGLQSITVELYGLHEGMDLSRMTYYDMDIRRLREWILIDGKP
jgi:hypothetical protein